MKENKSGANVKTLLMYASEANKDLYKYDDTKDLCVCIESNSAQLLNHFASNDSYISALKGKESNGR